MGTWLASNAGLFVEVRQAPSNEIIRARTALRQQIANVHLLAGLLVDKRQFYRGSGLSIREYEWWPDGAGNFPLISHFRECQHQKHCVAAFLRQEIFVAFGTCLVTPALN